MPKTIVITGASRGLGLCLAQRFLRQGDHVFGVCRTKDSLKTISRQMSPPVRFTLYRADLTQEQAVKRLVEKIKKQSRVIDVLINNAGYGGILERTELQSSKEFQKHLDHNLFSTYLMCKYFIPIFRKQKYGKIFNLSSMAGKRGVPRLAAYSASKFGIVGLTQAIAKENRDKHVFCVTICPGGMNTSMRADLFGAKDAKRQQSADFVAHQIIKIANEDLPVASGSDIVIRHGKITSIDTPPET
ncbi:MAG: SDR family oxidoreductase [Candidatus Omnitrophica bacterium]|nr:SDR family oxidoreductase [Candidatus Omnitrophota bacterium]